MSALAAAGVAALDIAGTTAVDAAALPAWIELNKAALRHGLPLAWSGQLPAAVRQQLLHLVPARDQPDWRRRWSYGMLGWRKGPDFAYVVDSRSGVRQFTLALPVLAGLFGPDLDQPARVADADRETLDELTAAGLALAAGEASVWLPYRTSRWPVSSRM